jgi:hypothetical protein
MRTILTILIAVACLTLCGCQTMTRDPDQQIRKYSRISEMNRRMMADDLDALLLLDRGSNLTPWYRPVR